ncbi:glucans biosynthesis protein [Cupriavidus gilardii J11]|uniref:Glucans biosynthesis protein n=1 Tax=Cupriavidus gilardii J11 TaxID=936133 RepID=A0A562BL84_9BURK|nr:glucans biosynthesis protein [Cupriavidus gilardii J11]
MNRRTVLVSAAATAALAALGIPAPALAAGRIKLAKGQPFSHEGLVALARQMATRPYVAPPSPPADILEKIDYDAHGKIRYHTDDALFANGPGQFPVTFFHLGTYFRVPVRMHVVEPGNGGAMAREIVYDESLFDMPADSPARKLPRGSGFAGFRFQESRLGDQKKLDWRKNDWVAFLGASYFRAIGELYQYGLSARGIAIDVAEPGKPEEFPVFTHFYFETPTDGSDTVIVHALLDGPSVTGAYRFAMQRAKGVVMDIDSAIFLRKDVGRLGLVPLTSMFWFSETVKGTGVDWRPEVHDSDGLAMWTGAGERIWRPLNNPVRTIASAFSDDNPRGFGLLQRDRNFDHYQDGVMYERRPSLWVEPRDGWGAGTVQLIEIPTDDEIHDNIVAMWVPKAPAKAGDSHPPGHPPPLARGRALSDPAGALRRHAPGQWRPAPAPRPRAPPAPPRPAEGAPSRPSPVRPACASSWSSSRAARWKTCPSAPSRKRCYGRRAASSPMSSPKPCPMACRATGARSST